MKNLFYLILLVFTQFVAAQAKYLLPNEEAVFSFDEISKDDLPLIVPGALFSWIMGRTERNGMIERNSEIRFRRIFKFSEFAIERAKTSATAMLSLLEDEV